MFEVDSFKNPAVGYKLVKKMKKRRDLDALVNGNKVRKKSPLLDNLTDSSDVEEFSVSGRKRYSKKQGFCHFCQRCLTVCCVFVLVACVSSITGLVWICVNLKGELDDLKAGFHLTSQNINGQVNTLSNQYDQLQKDVEQLKVTIPTLQQSLDSLQSTMATKKSQTDVTEIVANLGNSVKTLTSRLTDIETRLQAKMASADEEKPVLTDLNQVKNKTQLLEAAVLTLKNVTAGLVEQLALLQLASTQDQSIPQEIMDIVAQQVLDEVHNLTLDRSGLSSLSADVKNLSLWVADLQNQYTSFLGTVDSLSLQYSQGQSQLLSVSRQLQEVRQQLQGLINSPTSRDGSSRLSPFPSRPPYIHSANGETEDTTKPLTTAVEQTSSFEQMDANNTDINTLSNNLQEGTGAGG